MLISVAIFTIVMTISVGTLLVGFDGVRKTRLSRNAIENVSITMESMAKKIREGGEYHCGVSPPLNVNNDCNYQSADSNFLAFLSADEQTQFVFRRQEDSNGIGRVEIGECSGPPCTPSYRAITAPEVDIKNLNFYVYDSDEKYDGSDDAGQARVIITLTGFANVPGKEIYDTTFFLQTTVVRGLLDL